MINDEIRETIGAVIVILEDAEHRSDVDRAIVELEKLLENGDE